jgi:N-acetylmuramoyl-L-alanine amidase
MKVVIDPGHGGLQAVGGSSPNNAVGPNGLLEKSVTLDLALFAQLYLGGLGVECVLTRQTDVNLGLAARADVARRIQADAFVSIHFNASKNHDAQGTETWIHTRASAASRGLAAIVQAGAVAETRYRDRGVKVNSFEVLNPAYHAPGTAACLVELSFMDIATEEARLRDSTYKTKLANAVGQSIYGWLVALGLTSSDPSIASKVSPTEDFPEDGFEVTDLLAQN